MRLLGILIALLLGLTGCGGEDSDVHTGPGGVEFNDADVAFATQLIQQHAEELVLVDLLHTPGRQVSPALAALGEQVLSANTAEIEMMTVWLEDWERPVPATVRDHVNAGHGDEHATDAAELASLKGAAFEKAWAEAMIEHHEDAVELAEEELATGLEKHAKELATTVRKAQADRIVALEEIAASS